MNNMGVKSLFRFGKYGIVLADPNTTHLAADDIRYDRINDLVTLYMHKTEYTRPFQKDDPQEPPLKENHTYTFTELLKKIDTVQPSQRPIPVEVNGGVFSPAVLLSPGWWEVSCERGKVEGEWANNIQRWTYAGFDEWGPSWDFTSDPEGKVPHFLGQLGVGDEAESILVAAIRGCTEPVRTYVDCLLADQKTLAFPAMVKGLLCHRSYFAGRDPELRAIIEKSLPEKFGYCLLLNSDDHGVRPVGGDYDYYSGYLWQCLWAVEKAKNKDTPLLKDCYIIWEHTNLTKPDVIEYNLDGLRHKKAYIEDRAGELKVLQKSSRLVDGDPILSCSDFEQLRNKLG